MKAIENFKKELEFVMRAAFPVLWIRTHEEDRAIRVVSEVLKSLTTAEEKATLFIWDCRGEIFQYVGEDEIVEYPVRTKIDSPELLFPTFAVEPFAEKSVLVVLDFQFYLDQAPPILRSIKNALSKFRKDGKLVIFLSPRLPLPDEIEKDVSVIDFPLPEKEELRKCLDYVVGSAKKKGESFSEDELKKIENIKDKLSDAGLGLTLHEAEDAFSLAAIRNIRKLNDESIKIVLDQKCQVLRKEGMLEYITPKEKMEDIGGLDVIKSWLVQRKPAFGQDVRDFGLPSPKGILLVGLSGCGKSLVAKAAASNWQIGIYRLDVGKVFTKLMGESESNARKVIAVAETVAPCILWIDEIEKGMAGVRSSGELDSGVTARVTGTLLTWMQEKESSVFVIATANDVTKLPPELLRKGRFDEIFFVDLPNDEERFEIIKIQLRKRNNRFLPDEDIKKLVAVTKGYTGAEIEQAVIQGLFVCYSENKRDITQQDVAFAIKAFVPLAETMKEEISFLRTWGRERARAASGGGESSFLKRGGDASFLSRKLSPKEEEKGGN
jgi:ATP-dependent 26S proteasome regulatory subunit